jgi:predicted TPR repeat methyltransferase
MTRIDAPQVGFNWVLDPNQRLDDIEAEFDESAGAYEASSLAWDYRGARDGAAFFARQATPDSRVVEMGCGSGLVGQELALRGFSQLTGCDISAGMLELARQKGVYSGGLVKTDIAATPLLDASVDALLCIAVLTYANNIERVFCEFDRLVRPGGVIVFSHRVDLESRAGFAPALGRRIDRGHWRRIEVTEPQLYYPGRADYADTIVIRYHAYERIPT